jgi:hypothetical protein
VHIGKETSWALELGRAKGKQRNLYPANNQNPVIRQVPCQNAGRQVWKYNVFDLFVVETGKKLVQFC